MVTMGKDGSQGEQFGIQSGIVISGVWNQQRWIARDLRDHPRMSEPVRGRWMEYIMNDSRKDCLENSDGLKKGEDLR